MEKNLGESKERGLALLLETEKKRERRVAQRQLSKFVRLAYMIDYMGLLSSLDFRSQPNPRKCPLKRRAEAADRVFSRIQSPSEACITPVHPAYSSIT